ncbi:hypothetical protein JCM8547_008154 [Rhodosporidiobolus lusitaniae]
MRHALSSTPSLLLSLALLFLLTSSTNAGTFYSSERKAELRELAAQTWRHGFDQYKRVAFPADEVLPLSCAKQGHDRKNPENTGVNDVMGDYALTLVDSLDTFPMLNDYNGFEQAVRDTIAHVSFDVDSRVQVFEVTIRMMGGLLSGHLLAQPPPPSSGLSYNGSTFSSSIKGFALPWYRGELLELAQDLGRRLLPAFETPTGIPYARVHLQKGLRGKGGKDESGETCSAGAGSLLLEFITLSRLTSDPIFEQVARRAFFAVWNARSEIGLVGNTIDARSGAWMHGVSSTGAGIDSFFEYAAKAYVLTGDMEYHRVWETAYAALQRYSRSPDGFWYRGVSLTTGQLSSVLVDSLSAFFPGVQTLMGDLEGAVKSHSVYAFQWLRYGGLPEMFDTHKRRGVVMGYPLRPEFVESNMYLYQATKDDYYLSIAEGILHDINNLARVECGFAAVLNLETRELEDKMPSFVTSETLKYLYLTFDENNPFLRDDSAFVFTTEGHPLEIPHPPRAPSPSTQHHPNRNRNRNRKKRVFSPPPPTSSSSSSSTALPAAPTCKAHEPLYDPKHQHFLALSVERRTDWESARWFAGYDVEGEKEEEKERQEGRWSEWGWCEIPLGEDPVTTAARFSTTFSLIQNYVLGHLVSFRSLPPPSSISSVASSVSASLAPSPPPPPSSCAEPFHPSALPPVSALDIHIELLFASSSSAEITSPPSSQLRLSSHGDVLVTSISGLRFFLTRATSPPGVEGYVVSRVGLLRVGEGRQVVVRDEKVLAGLKEEGKRVEKVWVWAELGERRKAPEGTLLRREGEGRGKKTGKLEAFLGKIGLGQSFALTAYGEQEWEGEEEECGCGSADGHDSGDEGDWEEFDSLSSFSDHDPDSPLPTSLHIPGLAASFGPSLTRRLPSSSSSSSPSPQFILDGPPLPLSLPPSSNPFFCSPPSSSPSSPSPSPPSFPSLLLVPRGHCSFLLKSHHASLANFSGVVLVSSPAEGDGEDAKGEGFVVPSAGEEEIEGMGMKEWEEVVPMVLVGERRGRVLEEMVRRAGAAGQGEGEGEGEGKEVFVVVRSDEDEEEEEGPVVLGGYVVRNVKLDRTGRWGR